MSVAPYKDPNHPLNSSKYHTGKHCIEKGCENPAGTNWSPFWCVEHNIERLDRITNTLEAELKRYEDFAAANKDTSQ